MSSNKNLFYKLYSTNNNVVNAGYTCSSAIDENDTSFDITTSTTGGTSGTITDSNGNTLSVIDMSNIHIPGITQYNTETRILQPHSCCVLQGQEYGIAQAEYYYVIPKHVSDTPRYEYYISCDFDVIYNNFSPKKYHVSTIHSDADGHTPIATQINKQLKKFNIEVAASLITNEFDEVDKRKHDYLKFMAQRPGYFYYINNLRIALHFQSEDYPNSPFKKEINELKPYMYDLIEKYHPAQINDPEYDPETYEVNCDLYSWVIYNYISAAENLDSFNKMIEYLHKAIDDPEHSAYWTQEANKIIQGTPYNDDIFNSYDLINIEIIRDMVEEINEKLTDINDYYREVYWLREDRHRRIPLMKYPNGAFRGIVMIPDWPVNGDGEYSSLWVDHIKSNITLYVPFKDRQYMPKNFGVISNVTLVKEEKDFRQKYRDFGVLGLENSTSDLQDGWDDDDDDYYPDQPNYGPDDIDTDYLDPYRPDKDIADDFAWMGQNYYSKKNTVVGIFRYMQYVNDNNLWNKVGAAYMIIGNEDDTQSKIYNLPTSLLVYNPNDVPIRIKYMIFS